MPTLTRWYIKTSFVYLIAALVMGVLLAAAGTWRSDYPLVNFTPVYLHIFAEGWLTLLIIGVAVWMFPKLTLQKPRGSEALGWASYLMLNLGLVLRIISEPAVGAAGRTGSIWAWLLAVAALLQWAGGMTFVLNAWGRIKVK